MNKDRVLHLLQETERGLQLALASISCLGIELGAGPGLRRLVDEVRQPLDRVILIRRNLANLDTSN